jgi:hypothetical protein
LPGNRAAIVFDNRADTVFASGSCNFDEPIGLNNPGQVSFRNACKRVARKDADLFFYLLNAYQSINRLNS